MVARRIEMKTSRIDPTEPVEVALKYFKPEQHKVGTTGKMVAYIMLFLLIYHCYDAYS